VHHTVSGITLAVMIGIEKFGEKS